MRYYYSALKIAFGCFDPGYITLRSYEEVDVIQVSYRPGCYHDIILGAFTISICRFEMTLA